MQTKIKIKKKKRERLITETVTTNKGVGRFVVSWTKGKTIGTDQQPFIIIEISIILKVSELSFEIIVKEKRFFGTGFPQIGPQHVRGDTTGTTHHRRSWDKVGDNCTTTHLSLHCLCFVLKWFLCFDITWDFFYIYMDDVVLRFCPWCWWRKVVVNFYFDLKKKF